MRAAEQIPHLRGICFKLVYAILPASVRDGTSLWRRVRASKDVWGYDAIKTTTFGGPKLPQRRQNILRIRIVAERLTHVDEEVFVSRSKHKTSAELHRVLAQLVLFVSGGLSAAAGLRIFAAEKVEQGGVLQSNGFVGFTLIVDEKREVDAGFLAEEAGVLSVPQADHGDAGALLPEF